MGIDVCNSGKSNEHQQQDDHGLYLGTWNGNPTVETLNKIADAIGCPVTELFEQPKKDALTLTCPNCGKDINIKVE